MLGFILLRQTKSKENNGGVSVFGFMLRVQLFDVVYVLCMCLFDLLFSRFFVAGVRSGASYASANKGVHLDAWGKE